MPAQLFTPEKFTPLASLHFDEEVTGTETVFTENRLACTIDVYLGKQAAPRVYFEVRDVVTPWGEQGGMALTQFSFFNFFGYDLDGSLHRPDQRTVVLENGAEQESPLFNTPGWESVFDSEAGGALFRLAQPGRHGFVGDNAASSLPAIRGGGVFAFTLDLPARHRLNAARFDREQFAAELIEGVGLVAQGPGSGDFFSGVMTGEGAPLGAVPEPATYGWASLGLLALAVVHTRRTPRVRRHCVRPPGLAE